MDNTQNKVGNKIVGRTNNDFESLQDKLFKIKSLFLKGINK